MLVAQAVVEEVLMVRVVVVQVEQVLQVKEIMEVEVVGQAVLWEGVEGVELAQLVVRFIVELQVELGWLVQSRELVYSELVVEVQVVELEQLLIMAAMEVGAQDLMQALVLVLQVQLILVEVEVVVVMVLVQVELVDQVWSY